MSTKTLSRKDFDVLLDETISLMDRAIIFATRAHSDTYRKGTNIPYIVHPIERLPLYLRSRLIRI